MSSSAICTALRAAPLRRLSLTTHRSRPFSTVTSSRMRPTYTGSLPSASSGSGYCSSAGSPGIVVVDDPAELQYPLPLDAEGKDPVYVGRIREDVTVANGLDLWVVSDNLRKGAALNAVQIAEELVRRALL